MIKFLITSTLILGLCSSGFGQEFIGYIEGENTGDQMGSAFCTLDFNNDGNQDLVISAPASDEGGTSSGKVYLYYGGPAADLNPDIEIIGPISSFFGKSLSSAGDFNHDGHEDLLVGAPFYDDPATSAGAAYIYYGGLSPDNIPDLTFTGEDENDYFGIAVANVGDFNNDTYDDIAIGAYKADWGSYSNSGKTYVYYGGPSTDNVADNILVGSADGERFGYAITGGDFNGNGVSDIAVGAYSYDDVSINLGSIYIFYGGTSPGSSYDLMIIGESDGYKFGWSLAAGAVNTGTFDDLIMGTDGFPVDIYATGKIYIFHGGPSFDVFADDSYTLGRMADDYFGYSVASGVDISDDGIDDIIAGMPGNNDGDIDAGGAILFNGSESVTLNTTFLGAEAGEEFGKAVAIWPDYAGTNVVAVGAGAPTYDGYRGRVYLYQLGSSGDFICGEVDDLEGINILDIVYLINYKYKGGPAPDPLESGDVNSDLAINILDIVYLINYKYKGGPEPFCP